MLHEKIISICSLLLCLSVLFTSTVVADDTAVIMGSSPQEIINTLAPELETAVFEYLSFYQVSDASLENPIILYNLHDQPECVAYNISSGGFVYIDINNYQVLEYCPEGISEAHAFQSKVRSTPRFYYNGLMNIYYDNGENQVTHVQTGETYSKNDFAEIFAENPEPYIAAPSTYTYPITNGMLTDYTQPWSNYVQGIVNPFETHKYLCVPVAVGIMLEYYQRTFNYDGKYRYVPELTFYYTKQDPICHYITSETTPPNPGVPYISRANQSI